MGFLKNNMKSVGNAKNPTYAVRPQQIPTSIPIHPDIHVLRPRRLGKRNGVKRPGELQGVIGACSGVGDVPGLAVGDSVGVGPLVVDGGKGVGLASERAAGEVGAEPKRRSRGGRLGGLDHDVDALADAQRHDGRLVRLNRDEVLRHHRHVVPVDGDALHALRAAVDEAQAVRLPRLEPELGQPCVRRAGGVVVPRGVAVEVHPPVDQVVVGESLPCEIGCHDFFDYAEVVLVPPVCYAEREDGYMSVCDELKGGQVWVRAMRCVPFTMIGPTSMS